MYTGNDRLRLSAAILAAILAGLIAFRLTVSRSVPEDGLKPGEFRLEMPHRIALNDYEGGQVTLTVRLPTGFSPIPVEVRGAGMKVSASVQPAVTPAKMGRALVRIVPRDDDGVRTELYLETASVEKTTGFPGITVQETTLRGSVGAGLGKQPFRWTVEPGVYPQNAPLILGYSGEDPITLTVGRRNTP
ncbi:MAG: hypothetical protein SFU56_21520 [Capsulimonadales bacterium]|nr:hypothetical protein [Capsulimonadales bacterium]